MNEGRISLISRIMLQVAPFGFAFWVGATSSAEEPGVTATLIPPQRNITQEKPSFGLTSPPLCDLEYCGLNLDSLQDLWKRDALKREALPIINADTIIIERARFADEVQRFGDPHAPFILEYQIESLGLCFTGIVSVKRPLPDRVSARAKKNICAP